MTFLRLLSLLVFALAGSVFSTTTALAQVRASLIAEVEHIQPGQPFYAALRLEHQGHWHTYWVNPGTGLATSIEWELPEGFTAGEIEWPAPTVLRDRQGEIIGNGYEGEVLLPVKITPPENLERGSRVTLHAAADWLMCDEVCIPGGAALELVLRVAQPGADNVRLSGWESQIRKAIAELPKLPDEWQVSAVRSGDTITLTVLPTANAGDVSPVRPQWFFAEDNLVGYDLPQQIAPAPDGRGGYILALTVSPEMREESVERLTGVLLAEDSWLADSSLPGLRIDVPLEKAAAASGSLVGMSSSVSSAGLFATAALAFLGGLILNLMPCVFPVLGIKILGFVNQAGSEKRKVVAHGLVFTLGVLLSFWTLAGVLAVLRAGGEQLGWGFQLQSPQFVFGLAVLLLVFAMNLSGAFEFGLGATGLGAGLQTKSGLSGSFFTGVLATVVATPCSAPFLAPALGAALAMPVSESFLIFTAIAIGLSTPYLLLSIFPKAVGVLPRPGAWMETFKQFMAFPLYATVGYLLWVLAGQASENALLLIFFGLVVIALGLWCYGRLQAPGASAGRARAGLLGGAALLACGLWLGWPQAPAPTEVVWEPWSEELVAKYQREGRPIYLDFTARWCATCQTNKKLVFSSGEVLKTFADKNVAALKADWTSKDPKITAALAKYQKSAIPFNLVYLPGEPSPRELPSLLTPGIVLEALKRGGH
ncbi:protein-disulfide reductase DsbD family protein [Cephaloticoccus capnophilus]|uniref:protein-disulfide reductase DsbD family protein n=1 Tax=Cephaloticoccus capnophilus TaxID=1548208 RepID=UPI000ADADDC2|nr:protein-disulfide reductase DsbD domain-containing protein [Cephaloticoccus capnophilus]